MAFSLALPGGDFAVEGQTIGRSRKGGDTSLRSDTPTTTLSFSSLGVCATAAAFAPSVKLPISSPAEIQVRAIKLTILTRCMGNASGFDVLPDLLYRRRDSN